MMRHLQLELTKAGDLKPVKQQLPSSIIPVQASSALIKTPISSPSHLHLLQSSIERGVSLPRDNTPSRYGHLHTTVGFSKQKLMNLSNQFLFSLRIVNIFAVLPSLLPPSLPPTETHEAGRPQAIKYQGQIRY